MFGNRRKKYEQLREIFDQIYQQNMNFKTCVGQLEESRTHVSKRICEAIENTNELTTHAMLNIEEESKAISSIDTFSKELKAAMRDHAKLKVKVENQQQAVTNLIEENKNFDLTAKSLSEIPAALKQTNRAYEKQLDDMADCGKRMSVLALNAAIEAGRVGEDGMRFVSAAEEIRQAAVSYEKAANEMKEEVVASHAQIAQMEELIVNLFSLIRESNVSTEKLLKQCNETQKFMEKSNIRDFSEDMSAIRDKVVSIRNQDEKIVKNVERSKIQFVDIQEDVQNQKNKLADMESELIHLLDSAEKSFQ